MNYYTFFKEKQVICQEGLRSEELLKAEEAYNITFPKELKNLLTQTLPVSAGFYNWRDFSESNVKYIMSTMNRPFEDFFFDAAEVDWNEEWGEEPCSSKERVVFIREKLLLAPKLIPIFAHRYIPMYEGIDIPVFSIHGVDVACYGSKIDDYLEIEFGNRKYDVYSKVKQIPFWSEII